jgi:hypothetical protein
MHNRDAPGVAGWVPAFAFAGMTMESLREGATLIVDAQVQFWRAELSGPVQCGDYPGR